MGTPHVIPYKMAIVNWKIDGMTCANCALTVHKYLEKNGLGAVKVSLASGEVSFQAGEGKDLEPVRKGMKGLGYSVMGTAEGNAASRKKWNKHLVYLLICLPWTILLVIPHLAGMNGPHWLMMGWVQCLICLPVYITGMYFFGRSAVKSLLNGLPNMNVLIAVGATAAWVYSMVGLLMHMGPGYLFFETSASIITIVFAGYYVEDLSVGATQRSLKALIRTRKITATMIAWDDAQQEMLFPVESDQLRSGDLILIRSGEEVPADARILWGEAGVDESILSGESIPVDKKSKDQLIGGSILVSGTVRAQVTASGEESVLAGIVRMVKQAQGDKPPIQQLADRISAIFVPVVLGLALLTFIGNWFWLHELTPAIMRTIAVLLIACPCAMGLATPAAIAVGLGRGARKGILFRRAEGLEAFRNIRQVVFDKTGTLTTGEFSIRSWASVDPGLDQAAFKKITYSLEKYSSHPIARAITRAWKGTPGSELRWAKVQEQKGLGMWAETREGDVYRVGSEKLPGLTGLSPDSRGHSIYVTKNDSLIGYIDLQDEVREEAKEVIGWLHTQGIRTILLSGDRAEVCARLAEQVGIDTVMAERTPEQKLEQIKELVAAHPTAMVGDGINDAPALAAATVGISMSDASQLAMQTADVVLMNGGLRHLPAALGLGRRTYGTIRGNLFWAFIYNIVAIPVAALGLLTPTLAAVVMGLSDVVLAINSIRLYVRKLI